MLSVLVLALLACPGGEQVGIGVEPARAQYGQQDRENRGRRGGGPDLPSWARTLEQAGRAADKIRRQHRGLMRDRRRYGDEGDRSGQSGAGGASGEMRRKGVNPGEPDPIPLGGTEWLLAAGAGYALYRLRDDEDEDEDEE